MIFKFSKLRGAAIDSLANPTDQSNCFFSFIYGVDHPLINFRLFENKTDAPARVRKIFRSLMNLQFLRLSISQAKPWWSRIIFRL